MAKKPLKRREFLGYAGASAVAAITAGCTGGQSSQNSNGSGQKTNNNSGENGKNQDGGSQNGGTGGGKTVDVVQGQGASTLDPHAHTETTVSNIVLAAYDQLLFRDSDRKIYGELATDWKRVEDGRARFTIRKGVKFHNGDDLTPEDVAFSINRIVDEEVGGLVSPQASGFSPITGAETVDDKFAVDVISNGFNPIVFKILSGQNGQILEKSWVKERDKSKIAKSINGTGPFKLKEYKQNQKVLYERFEDYWAGPADVPRVEFRSSSEASARINQLLAGEADLVTNVPPQAVSRVSNDKQTRVDPVTSLRMVFCAMRYDVEPFDSPKFRQAMNFAVDNKSIVENVLQGFGETSNQPTQRGVFGYNSSVKSYKKNTKRAVKLVKESGYAGSSITLHTPVGRYLKDVEVAQAVVTQIDELPNVSCDIKQRDFNSLSDQLDGGIKSSPHFYLLGYANAISDATYTIKPLLTSDGALTSFKNEKIENVLDKAGTESNQKKRRTLLERANRMYHDQAPWVFLHQQSNLYGLSKQLRWEARGDEHIDTYSFSMK